MLKKHRKSKKIVRKDFRHVIVYTNKTFQEDIFKMNNVDQKAVNAIRVLSADAIQKGKLRSSGSAVGRGSHGI